MNATTLAARGAAVVVAAVAGAASFEHIASVAITAGERAWVGYALPLAIDGLIVVGVAALLEDKHQHRHARASARLAVLVGVVATLAANVASAEATWTARLVAITAPVSFLLSVEVLTRTGRRLSTPDDTTRKPKPATRQRAGGTAGQPRQGSTTGRPPRNAQRVARAVAATPQASPAEVAAQLHISERTVQRYWPTPAGTTPPEPNRDTATSARGAGVAPVPAAAFHRTDQPTTGPDRPGTRPDHAGVAT